ncbi:nucleotide-binding universal stress UspA family protein [Azonexus fungiphilus]|uniref:Universal stress protein n=1 Tax=Azonexus fungiphilus TaxID=146940 RepID=A0A495WGL8_9RHOO|nr:universal stress protein [Azonexus fungiphilus]RKT60666.1 nucleotide-binding universal stress UspA family protein [Azonexus fungiphilus]
MYKNILVAIDDSDTSRCALNEALHIARSSKAKLYICHVADETLMAMHGRTFTTSLNIDNALQAIANAGRKLLDDALAEATDIDAESVLLEARNRRVSETIADKAGELGVDLIIIGRHGRRGLATLILGSVAEQLARIASASVLLVRQH